MAEMTLEEFLQRCAGTEYLPDWLNDKAAELLEAGDIPDTDPEPVEIPLLDLGKWCPFSSTVTPTLRIAHNRTYSRGTKENPGSMSLHGSMCVRELCQMWTGEDCGMKK